MKAETNTGRGLASVAAFGAGLLFTLGLGLSGMTKPSKVIGFLDVFGRWDPSLALVMGGAVLVGVLAFRLVLRRPAPVLAERFHLPTQTRIDAPLVVGAALFGVGWGLSGYCPGPALASLVTFGPGALVFVAAMLSGMGLHALWSALHEVRLATPTRATRSARTSPRPQGPAQAAPARVSR